MGAASMSDLKKANCVGSMSGGAYASLGMVYLERSPMAAAKTLAPGTAIEQYAERNIKNLKERKP
jgi:hypothetical protein